jgi:hypothetical protein
MATDERNKRIMGLVKTEEGWDLLLKTKAKNLLEVQEDLITMKNSKMEDITNNRYGNLSFKFGREELLLIELPEGLDEWIDLNNQLVSVGLQVIHRLDNSTDSKYFYLEILECESLRPIRLIEDNRFYSMSELITFLMQ